MDEMNQVVVEQVEPAVTEETYSKADMSKAVTTGVAIGAAGTVGGYFIYRGIKKLINKIREKKSKDETVVEE